MAEMNQMLTQMQHMGGVMAEMTAKIQQLEGEKETLNKKTNFLHGELATFHKEIVDLKARGLVGHGSGGREGNEMGSLINMKTMEPKSFGGTSGESFRTWAKKIRAYVNGHRSGFKKFLKWVEAQTTPINMDDMDCDWKYKESAAGHLYDFLMMHVTGDAQVIIELIEDNGPEA